MSRSVQPHSQVSKPVSKASKGAQVVDGADGELQRGRPRSDQRRMTARTAAPPDGLLLLSDPAERARVVSALARVILEEESRSLRGGFGRDR